MPPSDPRPRVWVGHVTLPTADLAATHGFMAQLGMRPIAQGDDFAVLEPLSAEAARRRARRA